MRIGQVENQFDASHLLGHMVSLGAVVVSFRATLDTIAGYIPYIAGLVAILWYLLQIWESPVVQRLRPKPTPMERERKLALLVASAKVLSAEIVALQLVTEAKVTAGELIDTASGVARDLKASASSKS